MSDLHHYNVTVIWTGNTGTGTTGYKDYSRAFELEADGKHGIAGSSDPAFRGDDGRWNPEQLLVGSLSSCHKLWVLHLAAVAGVVITSYVDHAEGTMRTTPGAESGQFESVILRPEVTVTAGCDANQLTAIHEDAHRRCFIANSVNFPVRVEPVTLREGELTAVSFRASLSVDISAIEGEELSAVEFISDYLRLRFGEAGASGPALTLYAWPHILLADFSIAYGEPEYRNALCAQIGETVQTAKLEELDALTIEFESGTVIALSLREEDLDGPEAGSFSADGTSEEEF